MPLPSSPVPKYTYTVVPSLFQQSLPHADGKTFDYASQNFGLLSPPSSLSLEGQGPCETPTSPSAAWASLRAHLRDLNTTSPLQVSYKLLYLSRHGSGLHNLAEATYGREAWDATYCTRTGNEELGSWVDAQLTETGITQALQAREFWGTMLADGVLVPGRFYVSPLERCLATARITWGDLGALQGKWKPCVVEQLRETSGRHPCDKRSPTSVMKAKYPEFEWEEGVAEEDELWEAGHRESFAETDMRVRAFLDVVWGEGEGVVSGEKGNVDELDATTVEKGPTVLSFTTHSGWIAGALRVIGHREFRPMTGGIVPVVVRGEKVVE